MNIELLLNLLKLEIGDIKSYKLFSSILKNNNINILLSIENIIKDLDDDKLIEVKDVLTMYNNDDLVHQKYGKEYQNRINEIIDSIKISL